MCLLRLILPCLILFLVGCGGDGESSAEPPESPQFDLTGQWVATEIDCATDVLTQATIDEIEAETLQGMGLRIVQMGNDLEITDLDDGSRYDGTISGDQVRYTYSESRRFNEGTLSVYVEAQGTVVDANHIVGTEYGNYTFDGEPAATASCTGRYQRA